ncbi:MAG: T9SS type A sorting domain-containing protein [Ferruginibacter sp.]
MKQKILCILFCALFIHGFSQTIVGTQKTLGGNSDDQLGGLWPTTDGGVVLGGRSYSYISGEKTENNRGIDDYWVVKLNKAGDIEWQRTLGGTDIDEILALQQTKDGGYILAGNSLSNSSADKVDNKGVFDFWVIKLNRFGSVEWQRTLGGDSYEFCNSVQQTKDGGFLLGGASISNISGDKSENSKGGYDFWIVKLNRSGIKLWDKTLGGSGDEFLNQVIETGDGGYFLGGISTSNISGDKSENSRGLNDFWAVKLDKNRKIQWDKTAGGADNDYVNGLVQTPDDGFVLSGASASNISGEKTAASRGGFDFWLVKLNKLGKIQFDKTMGGSSDEFEATVENTSDGGLVIGGNSSSSISGEKTENSRGLFDYWIIKLSRNGTIAWDKTIGGNGYDNVRTVKEIGIDKYIIGGYSSSDISGDKTEASRGGYDYWIVNLNYKGGAACPPKSNIAINSIGKQSEANTPFGVVFPNPAKDVVNIRMTGVAEVLLINESGKIIASKLIENNGTISVANLPAGVYFLKNNTTGTTQKIIISK